MSREKLYGRLHENKQTANTGTAHSMTTTKKRTLHRKEVDIKKGMFQKCPQPKKVIFSKQVQFYSIKKESPKPESKVRRAETKDNKKQRLGRRLGNRVL